MKFSEAMLEGFKKVDGRQCKKSLFRDRRGEVCDSKSAYSVCANGAAMLTMLAGVEVHFSDATDTFIDEYGFSQVDANNEGMPWEHIYGMAVAAGL